MIVRIVAWVVLLGGTGYVGWQVLADYLEARRWDRVRESLDVWRRIAGNPMDEPDMYADQWPRPPIDA